jgi:beta-glucanase (GH16 family)
VKATAFLPLLAALLAPLAALPAAESAAAQEHPPVPTELAESRLPPGKKWRLVWSDEFIGTELDRTKWDYRLHIMHTRFDTWTEDAASLDGKGSLLLKVYEKDGNYYTSQLQTGSNFMDLPGNPYGKSRFTWPIGKIATPRFMHKYGYYEIRCQLPKQPGYWAAFWLQSPTIGSTLDPGTSGVEIDVMENFTRDGVISHNIHWNGYGADHQSKGSGPVKQPELSEGFHTFGVDWSREGYVFYTDGKVTWRVAGPVSDREEFILVSTECNGYRAGGPAPELKEAKLPDFFVVDHVRVFDPVGEETSSPPAKP